MHTECSTGTVFQFDSYGVRLTAVCIGHQNGKVQCFRVCTDEESSQTIGMHMSDGCSVGPNYRIAYKSQFEIYASQMRTLLFTCRAEDISLANRLHSCLVPMMILREKLADSKRSLSRLTDEAREQALDKIERLNEELYERQCIFLREHLYKNKSKHYENFRIVPDERGITQIYGLYQEWHARKIYR